MGINCIRAQISQPKATFLYQNMIQPITDISFNNDFKPIQLLGKGSYAQVYRAYSVKAKNQRAIKKIDRKRHPKIQSILIRQFQILKQMDHPNILKVYQIYEQPSYYYIVSQLCPGNELYYVLSMKKYFTEEEACIIFYQLASAIMYMHQRNIMHRDLKPENIMYDSKNQILKIIDFGSAVAFSDEEIPQKRRVGTSYYIAPEVLLRSYDHRCDIWSAGVILFILLSGEPPFKGREDQQILQKVKTGSFGFTHRNWNNISLQAKMLIKSMLQMNPKMRPSMKEIMKHDWITKFLKKQELDHLGLRNMEQFLKNMKKFKEIKSSGIEDGMLVFIVNFIKNPHDEADLVKCFKELDLNGDGLLSKQELSTGLSKYLGLSSKEADVLTESIFKKVDTNHSGYIDYSEFIVSASNIEMVVTQQNLDLAFNFMDKDNNGHLSANQIRSKLGTNLPEEAYTELLKQFKMNKDGQISKTEFVNIMKKLIKKL